MQYSVKAVYCGYPVTCSAPGCSRVIKQGQPLYNVSTGRLNYKYCAEHATKFCNKHFITLSIIEPVVPQELKDVAAKIANSVGAVMPPVDPEKIKEPVKKVAKPKKTKPIEFTLEDKPEVIEPKPTEDGTKYSIELSATSDRMIYNLFDELVDLAKAKGNNSTES